MTAIPRFDLRQRALDRLRDHRKMHAHGSTRELRVAGPDGFYQPAMFRERGIGATFFGQRETARPIEGSTRGFEHAQSARRFDRAEYRRVKVLVEIVKSREIARAQRGGLLLQISVKPFQQLRIGLQRHPANGLHFERRADEQTLAHVLSPNRRHETSMLGKDVDQRLVGQPRDRLAHGRARHAESDRDLFFP